MGTFKDYSSYFIPGKALFGGFPTQEQTTELMRMGVHFFVDLTFPEEVGKKYNIGNGKYINFPIPDRKVPFEISRFAALVLLVSKTIDELKGKEKIYIHCKGGHGRSGLLVAALICFRENIHIDEAVAKTTAFHDNRLVMRQKWRDLGSPQTKVQKTFLFKFFRTLYFFRAYRKGTSAGFSNYSLHSVLIGEGNDLIPHGLYPSSEAAFQASKNPSNENYIKKQQQSKNPRISRTIGDRQDPHPTWMENRYRIMRTILISKMNQNPEIVQTLTRTGLRRIVYNSRTDFFFGIGPEEKGGNLLGKILMEIRSFHYFKLGLTFTQRLKEFPERINGENTMVSSV